MSGVTVDLVPVAGDDRSRSRRGNRGMALLFFGAVAVLMMQKPAKRAVEPVAAMPRVLNFNVQPAGSVSQQLVTFRNPGRQAFAVTSLVLDGPSSTGFTVSADTCRSIAAGARCSVTVTFSPPRAGDYAGSLTLASGDRRSETVQLLGSATAQAPAPSAHLTATPPRTSFDPQPVGSTAVKNVEIVNDGNADFVLTGFAVDGTASSSAFAIAADPCSRLAPRQTCEASISFTPAAEGAHAASVVLLDGSSRAATLQL